MVSANMLSFDEYYELWDGHTIQVWNAKRLVIVNHPIGCNITEVSCREKIIKYIHNEGLFDDVLDTQITLLDSYAENS